MVIEDLFGCGEGIVLVDLVQYFLVMDLLPKVVLIYLVNSFFFNNQLLLGEVTFDWWISALSSFPVLVEVFFLFIPGFLLS